MDSETRSAQRLDILARTQDGFEIAQTDMELRGPGELVGKRQHGIPVFKAADLLRDLDLLDDARADAAALLQQDPTLDHPAHQPIKRALLARYAQSLALADVA